MDRPGGRKVNEVREPFQRIHYLTGCTYPKLDYDEQNITVTAKPGSYPVKVYFDRDTDG